MSSKRTEFGSQYLEMSMISKSSKWSCQQHQTKARAKICCKVFKLPSVFQQKFKQSETYELSESGLSCFYIFLDSCDIAIFLILLCEQQLDSGQAGSCFWSICGQWCCQRAQIGGRRLIPNCTSYLLLTYSKSKDRSNYTSVCSRLFCRCTALQH